MKNWQLITTLLIGAVIIGAVILGTARARTYIIVQDPNTVQIESKRIITTFGVTKTTLVTAPDDPNCFILMVRFKVKEL